MWVRAIVGILILTSLAILVDIGEILVAFDSAHGVWLAVAALLITFATLIGSWNLHLLMNRSGEIPWKRFLPIYWAGWALGLVVPGQIGDIAGISALLRRHGIPIHISIGRSLVDKVASVFIITMMGGGGILMYGDNLFPEGLPVTLSRWTGVICGILVALLIGFAKTLRRRLHNVRRILLDTIIEITSTARTHPVRVLVNLFFSAIKMSLTGLAYWAAFIALGQTELDPIAVTLLAAGSSLVAYIPVSVNGLGTAELAGVVLFDTLSIPPAKVVAAYILLRVIVLLLAWTPFLVWMWRLRSPKVQT